MDKDIGPPLPISSLRLLFSPVLLVSGAIWHTVRNNVVSDYGMFEEFVAMVTDIVPDLLTSEQKNQLLLGLRARTGFPEEFGFGYDEALVKVTWEFLSRLERMLLPLHTIQQVALMLADIPSALEECLKSVSHRSELQTLLGRQKELLDVRLDKNACPLDGAHVTLALHLGAGGDIKTEEGRAHSQGHTLPDVHAACAPIEGQYASTAVTVSEATETAVENAAKEGTRRQEFSDVFEKDCRVLLKRLEDVPPVQRRPVRSNRGLKMKRILLQEKNARQNMPSKQTMAKPQRLPSMQSIADPFPSVTYTVEAYDDEEDEEDDTDSVNSLTDPSYMAPIGSSSGEDSSSDCSSERRSCMELASPREGRKPSVTLKNKEDTLKIKLATASTTSRLKGLCLICNKHVQMDMKEHVKAHFPDGVLTCPQCDAVFRNIESLWLHFKRVCFDQLQLKPDNPAQGLFKCDKCERSFRSQPQLHKHKLTHSHLYCEVCRRVVRDAKTLARHKVSHTSFQCTRCEKSFGIFKHLSSHCRNVHHLRKPYKCHYCTKVFSMLHVLIGHEWKHTGQPPFQCSQCGLRFKHDSVLELHQRVHNREKPYPCLDCGKYFSNHSNRARHRRLIHNESRRAQFSSSQRVKDGAHQKQRQEKPPKKKPNGPCKHCGTVLHSSHLCPRMSPSGNESNPLTSEMAAVEGANIEILDSDSVSLLQDPSHVAPVGSSSKDDFFPSSSNHSSLPLSDHEDCSTALTERDSPLRKHAAAYKTDSSKQKRPCFICKKHVQMPIKEHMKTHFPDGVLKCPRCDALLKNMSSLRLHCKRVCIEQLQIEPGEARVGQGLFKCDQCVKSYRYKLSLDGHKRTHNQLYCEVCRRVMRDAETLARHKASHMPFECTLCEKQFRIFKHLAKHYENVHKLDKPYKCHHCPKVFSMLRLFIRHEWQHTGQLPLQCSHCSMRFKQDTDLVLHLRVHTQERPYLCADCGSTFSCNSNLRRHIKFRHSEARDTRNFPCPQCGKTFKEKGAMQKHEQHHHQNEKRARHPCTYCGKMFSLSAMTRHKMVHTGEKPLKCHVPQCDRRFRSTTEVKNHVLRHHSADRPFECKTCGKGFIRASILNDHMKIHSGEKNHVCVLCGKAFMKIYSMNRHIQLVHTTEQQSLSG